MSVDLSGWAIRRNASTCLEGRETDCGATRSPFRACCPSSTVCPRQYNVACCPYSTGENCTATLVETPRCANSSWIMYDNGGFFCCQKGEVGYDRGGTNGCSRSGLAIPDGALPLAVVDQGTYGRAHYTRPRTHTHSHTHTHITHIYI